MQMVLDYTIVLWEVANYTVWLLMHSSTGISLKKRLHTLYKIMGTGEEPLTVLNLILKETYTQLIMNIMQFFDFDIRIRYGKPWHTILVYYGPTHFPLQLTDIFMSPRISCIVKHVIIGVRICV